MRALQLTPKGRALLARCDAEVDRFERAFFGELSGAEQEVLRGLLIRVIAADRSAQATASLQVPAMAAKRSARS